MQGQLSKRSLIDGESKRLVASCVSVSIDHIPTDASRTPRGQRIFRAPLDAASSRLEKLAKKRLQTT